MAACDLAEKLGPRPPRVAPEHHHPPRVRVVRVRVRVRVRIRVKIRVRVRVRAPWSWADELFMSGLSLDRIFKIYKLTRQHPPPARGWTF